jgi:hypothetical protein
MDANIVAGLAATAGGALAAAMTTDAWNMAKSVFARILGHSSSLSEEQAASQLEESRKRLIELPSWEYEDGCARTAAEWSTRIRALLEDHPILRSDLAEAIARVEKAAGERGTSSSTPVQRISAGRDAYVAGRDQYIDWRHLQE